MKSRGIKGIATLWKSHLRLFLLNLKYYQNEIWSSTRCAAWQTFLKCFWLNAGDWKLVPGPSMTLRKLQYSEIWPLLIGDIYHF